MPKRVLIADDNESVRRVVRSFIEQQEDMEVCALTGDGVETVDMATALCPDLVILDVLMPGLNGVEVASILRKRLPNVKTVVFTLYGDSVRTLAPTMGANAVITKTDGISGLLKTLRRFLSTRLERIDRILADAALDPAMDPHRMQSLARDLGAPLTRCTRDLKYAWVSQEYASWLQKPADKIAGRSILNVLGAEAFSDFRHRFDQALSGQPVTYEAETRYEKIGRRRILAAYRPILQPGGRAEGWLACVQDITDGKPEQLAGTTDFPIQEVA